MATLHISKVKTIARSVHFHIRCNICRNFDFLAFGCSSVSLTSLLHQVRFQMLSNLKLHISGIFETLSSMKFHQKSEPSNTFDQFQPSLNTGATCSSRTKWRHVCVSCCIHDLMSLLDDGRGVGEEISLFHMIQAKISHHSVA